MPSRPSTAPKQAAEGLTETIANLLEFPSPTRVKNPAAVALGKLGGSKGGKIRAQRLSGERKKEIAQQAAKARWAREKAE